jgi:hypothetical protein
VDPVPDFFGSAGNRTRCSGSETKNSDHWTTEAVNSVVAILIICFNKIMICFYLHGVLCDPYNNRCRSRKPRIRP